MKLTPPPVGRRPKTLEECYEALDHDAAVQEQLCTAVEKLAKQVTHLEEKLRTNSQNSSKPPSSDPNRPKVPPRKDKRKRKRGGQKGRKGTQRKLVPVDQVDELHEVYLTGSCACGGEMEHMETEPRRHQVFELPKVKPLITEYRLHKAACDCCGRVNEASLPEGVPAGMLGPRAMSTIGVMGSSFRLSRRLIKSFLKEFFSLDISLGLISKVEKKLTKALEPYYEAIRQHVLMAKIVNMDETTHYQCNKSGYMWLAVTQAASFFAARLTRSGDVAREILGEKSLAILGSDRYSGYAWFDAARRQICWAHLFRDLTKIQQRDESGFVGDALAKWAADVFELWGKFRDGKLQRKSLIRKSKFAREQFEGWLEWAAKANHEKTAGTCAKLMEVKAGLWTFLFIEGVDPTNNVAERTIRSYVIKRKLSFGSQSERGDRFLESIYSVMSTCKQQDLNIMTVLTDAVRAMLCGTPPPPLLSA